jgi:hypothetical protein
MSQKYVVNGSTYIFDSEITDYTNGRDEKFLILTRPDGSVELTTTTGKTLMYAKSGWTIDQAKKWAEL